MFDPSYSAFNWLLEHLGLDRISWLGATGLARFSVHLATVWFVAPFFLLIYLASFNSVPEPLRAADRRHSGSQSAYEVNSVWRKSRQ
mgnify:CR=1 FL=1